jgi:membrane protease YdiL (CAAX protease family)
MQGLSSVIAPSAREKGMKWFERVAAKDSLWSIAVFVFAVFIPLPAVFVAIYAMSGHSMALLHAGVRPSWIGSLLLVAAGLMTVALQRRVHGERWLPQSLRRLPACKAGALTAATALLVMGGGAACAAWSQCWPADGGHFVYRFLLPQVPLILISALYEELYFREAMYGALLRAFHRVDVALLVQAIVFGFSHYRWGRELAMAMGLWFGLARVWSGSIWVATLVHAIYNTTLYALFGKPSMPIHLLGVTPAGAETSFMTAIVVAVLSILCSWRLLAGRVAGLVANGRFEQRRKPR